MFWGAGDELGQALPLLPFLDGLRVREPSANPRRNTIVRLLRGEVAADRGTDVPAVLAEQLLALVAEQCAVRPTILVVDDLQWADQASVTLWGRLARSAQQVPLLLVGMMRPAPQRDDLLALRRVVGDDGRLQLTGLTGVAVADLVADLAGGKPDDNLLRLADGAAGNPLYLTELVAALARSSSLTVTEAGAAELAGGSAPSSLSAAIADRLGFVAGPVREVLRAAALLGMDFAVPDLAIVLGRSVADLIPAVDEACAVGVLAESGHGLGFRHPLIRAALYDDMPAPVRAAWHRDAGRALAEAGAPADRVARQMLRALGGPGDATEPVDEWMLDWLAHTADPLVGQAPGVAAELLARAVASSPAASAQHGWLASRLADALYRIGDRAEAEQVANRALEYATEPDLLVDLHWTLAQCRMLAGESAESLATLDRALASPGISVRHRARLLVLAARTHRQPRRGRRGRPGRHQRARSGVRGRRQLGHGLGVARADARDRDAGASDRRAAAVRPGADRDPGRSGTDRSAAAAAAQQGRHAGQSRPVRGGLRRGRAGTAPRGPGRHDVPADSGALRPGPVAVRNGPMGRRADRGRDPARGPEGTRRGLLRSRHRRRDLLPPRRDRRGASPPRRCRPARQADRPPAYRPTGAGPQPGLRACRRATGGAGRADRRVRRQYRRRRGDRGPACRRRPPRRRDRRHGDRTGPGGPGRRARRRIGDPAPAGERAVLPRPAGPRCPPAARGRGAL